MAFVVAVVPHLTSSTRNVPNRDYAQFQSVIQKKQHDIELLQEKLVALPDSADFGDFEAFREKYIRQINNNAVSFLVFENQKILYWSDNTVPPYY